MHVVTDDERREVAERLRSVAREVDRGGFSETIKHVKLAVFEDLDRYRPNGTLDRLADLIEPGEPKVKCVAEVKVDGERLERLVHDAAVELAGIDREALLALAEEICENADISRELHSEMLKEKRLDMALTFHEYAFELREYAERIREALGVTDG